MAHVHALLVPLPRFAVAMGGVTSRHSYITEGVQSQPLSAVVRHMCQNRPLRFRQSRRFPLNCGPS